MTTSEIFIVENLKYFPEKKHQSVIENAKELDEKKLLLIQGIEFKKPNNWLLLYLFCPFFFLIDRLLLKDTFKGVLKIIIPVILISLGGAITIYEMKEYSERIDKRKIELNKEESNLTAQIENEFKEKENAINKRTRDSIFSGIKEYPDMNTEKYNRLSTSEAIAYMQNERYVIKANGEFEIAKIDISSQISSERDSAIGKLHDKFLEKLYHDDNDNGRNFISTIGYSLIVISIVLFFIFMIVDIFTIKERVRENNYQAFDKIVKS